MYYCYYINNRNVTNPLYVKLLVTSYFGDEQRQVYPMIVIFHLRNYNRHVAEMIHCMIQLFQ